MIHERMLSEQMKLENQIHEIKAKLEHLPDGKLVCSHSGKYAKWFQSDGHTKVYIPKQDRKLAEALATKKYLSLQLEDLENEKRAIDFYLRHSSLYGKAQNLLKEESEYQHLLTPYFKPLSEELYQWQNASYEKSPLYPEQLIHNNGFGNAVRTKSEAMIEMVLHINRIPYRYECALHLGEMTLYPDFTIRHPETGKTYYWEHFGMMDNPAYSKKVFGKQQQYALHGIVPSLQLITTYETKTNPLTMETIQKLVQQYFVE